MEHESFVPAPSARLAGSLRTPAAVAAALPGWQPDPGTAQTAPTAQGRLRLRVAGSTVTYRGHFAVEGDSSPFGLVARGTEVRGDGMVAVNARITLADTEQPESGTAVTYEGTAEVTGRLASYDPAVVEAAVRRLLDRFAAGLAEQAARTEPPADAASAGTAAAAEEPGQADASAEEPARGGTVPEQGEPGTPAPDEAALPTEPGAAPDEAAPPVEDPAESATEPGSGPEPATAGPMAGSTDDGTDNRSGDSPAEDPDAVEEPDVVDDLGEPSEDLEDFELVEVELEVPESAAALDDLVPPAEAAHARRTMIGRSAEEVDHAPPRGRYAPAPAPDASSAVATLRWAAPAAAALLASAVVVGRVLRRRR